MAASARELAEYRERLHAGGDAAGQDDVDRVLGGVRPTRPAPLPKGMGRETLDAVVAAVRAARALNGVLWAATAVPVAARRTPARSEPGHASRVISTSTKRRLPNGPA